MPFQLVDIWVKGAEISVLDICSTCEYQPGDVSGDGSITAYDASLILQYIVNLIDYFPDFASR